jgi:hypothetical protein
MRGFNSLATRSASRTIELVRSVAFRRPAPGIATILAGAFFLGLFFANLPMAAALATQRHSALRHRAILHAGRRRATLETKRFTSVAEIAPLPLQHYSHLPPLRGSHESLVRQNERDEQEGLERIQDDDALAAMARNGQLVALPISQGMRVDERLEEIRRYCRPWAAAFLTDLSRVHYARFHSPLQVNSAVRTVAYQKHLLLINGNAAPAEGDVASPHLTGAAIDIAKKGLSTSEIGWMRAYLLPLEAAGKIDVEEEFQQACFHITVYQDYRPVDAPLLMTAKGRTTRSRHRRGSILLATRLH